MGIFSFNNRILMSINGFLLTLFGIIALLFPRITLITLTVFFAVFILIGGFFLIIASIKAKEVNTNWYLFLIEGIIGILLGLIILSKPELTAAIFVTLLGVWAILMGIIFVITFFRKKMPGYRNRIMFIMGILSLIFGMLIAFYPFESSRTITALIGVYAMAYGILSIINNSKLYN